MAKGIKPLVCAHAGCEGTACDSLDSVSEGIASGADIVEIDLRFTASGELVLSHDPVVAEKAASLARFESVLELLSLHPDVALNVDVKESGRMTLFEAFLSARQCASRIYCTGLNRRQLKAFRAACPTMLHTVDDLPFMFFAASRNRKVETLKELKLEGAMALNLEHRLVNESLVEACGSAGMPLRVWTVDDTEAMRRMIGFGVEAITTNRVSVLKRILS